MTWRINQEPALLLGGGRALLMQLAHPGVAAGVAEHSDFRLRPLHRLIRTLELTLALTFGTREQALAAARQINAVHQRVHGAHYSATDPRLLLWVHATLIDSALVTYAVFVGPLGAADRETYYQEAKLIGGLLGLANSRYPAGLVEFDAYLAGMLESAELVVDARARELATAVLRPPLRRVPPPAFRPVEVLTAGLLPERLRLAYGLRWGRLERLGYQAARAGVPWAVRLLPSQLLQVPAPTGGRASSSLKGLDNR
ncbi:MAG TPA: oxygenase MpaB family protein [Candidatus Eisenbacteria bacterium]|nr:oxygenase MpaB family protein [Candidatus Eisenbacteria bacterium]